MKKTARRGVVPIWMVLLALSCGPGFRRGRLDRVRSGNGGRPWPGRGRHSPSHRRKRHRGIVAFEEMGGGIHVMAHVTGLEPGRYGLHVHEMGDCSSGGRDERRRYLRPRRIRLGNSRRSIGRDRSRRKRHGHFMTDVQQIALSEGPRSVVGRSIVIMTVGGEAITSWPAGHRTPGAGRHAGGVGILIPDSPGLGPGLENLPDSITSGTIPSQAVSPKL